MQWRRHSGWQSPEETALQPMLPQWRANNYWTTDSISSQSKCSCELRSVDTRSPGRLRRERCMQWVVQLLLRIQCFQEQCVRLLWKERSHYLLLEQTFKEMSSNLPFPVRLCFSSSSFPLEHGHLLWDMHSKDSRCHTWLPHWVPRLPQAQDHHREELTTTMHRGFPSSNEED